MGEKIAVDGAVFGIIDFGEGPETVVVLVQDNDKDILAWKCPGGRGEEGDRDTESALVRELLEEIGIKTEPQAEIHRGNYTTHTVSWWIVKPLEPKESMRPGTEIHDIRLFTKSECLDLIAGGSVLATHARALEEYFKRFAF